VRAVAWADEAEQQLSTLAPSDCQLFGDMHILEQGCERSLAGTPRFSQATFEI